MSDNKRKPKLWQINLIFFFILFMLASSTNSSRGVNADMWIIPIIMAIVGSIGAFIGGVPGALVGLVWGGVNKDVILSGMKYGASVGYVGILLFWFISCWMNGSSVCFAQ